jgi:hypothetical protein
VDVLAEVFRAKFDEALKQAFARGQLGFHGKLKELGRPKAFSSLLRQTFSKKWVVYAKPPFGGPEHALRYLGCYTPPRRHLQPPPRLVYRRAGDSSLAGLQA